jgi:NAD(P)-dependent dehydrogenase (short-subunit alcohol dehydrogenase family)
MNIRKPAVDMPLADWDRIVSVNMTAVFLCARTAARHMIAAGRGGAVVNTASIMSLSGGGLYPNISYQTTKGALVNMTRALAVEWAQAKIRVNAVAPTWVRTPFIAPLLAQPDIVARIEQMTPLGRLAEAHEVATAMLFLASPAAAMITGHTLPVDGGFLAQ